MNAVQCPYCGQAHPPGAVFCPATGRPLQAAPGMQQPAPYGQAPSPQQGPLPQPRYGQPYGAPPPAGQPPYGQNAPYGQQQPPQQPQHYGQPPPPGQQPPYGQPGAYGQQGPQPPYGQQPGYGQAPPYGQPPPYGHAAPYGQPPPGAPPAYGASQAGGFGPGKSVGVILTEAFQLYQKHLVALLVTSAILLVPVSFAKSAAIALMMAPTAAVEIAARNTAQLSHKTATDWQRELKAAEGDPQKLAQLSQERQKELQDLGRSVVATGAVAGGMMVWLLGLLAMLFGIAVLYGIAVPLVTGALTIIVADRATGGTAGPGEAYKLLMKRLGKFLSAWIPAFFFVMCGLCFLVIPGLILGFLFTFVAPVVLLENVGGMAALKRSVSLVKANVLQVFVVGIVFAVIRIASQLFAHLFIPRTAFFVDSLVQDLLLMLLLPVPIIGTVLLYLDIRRQADGLDERGVRAGIEGLRQS